MVDRFPLDLQHAEFFSQVSVFQGISQRLYERLAQRAAVLRLPAGEWLFREGDPGDRLYVLYSGRLEIVAEDGQILNTLGRGSVVGELAVLTSSPRSASIRAKRDSELIELEQTAFHDVLRDEPEFAISLTRVLGQQLRQSRPKSSQQHLPPAVIAVVSLDASYHSEIAANNLAQSLRISQQATVFSKPKSHTADSVELLEELNNLEANQRYVLLPVDLVSDSSGAVDFCLRQSDYVLVIVGNQDPSRVKTFSVERLKGADLLVERSRATTWSDLLEPRATYSYIGTKERKNQLDSVARRLTRTSLGIVFSGGGARGYAHVGVIEALEEAGLQIDRIAGCSMGAFVGGQYALGLSASQITEICEEEFVRGKPLSDYTLPLVSLVRGVRGRSLLERTFASHSIEQALRSFLCVSADIVGKELVVHRRGRFIEAVGASMCLPGVLPPVLDFPGRVLVDGGVLNNLPVEQLATDHEGPVIAVDVTANRGVQSDVRYRRPRGAVLQSYLRRFIVGSDQLLPTFKETLLRTIVLGSADTTLAAQKHADLLIAPAVSTVGLLDFERLAEVKQLGYRAAIQALEKKPISL